MKRTLLALAVLAAVAPFGVGASDATFVAASSTPAGTFATAADFNTVAVTLTDPGTPLRATVTLSATATSDRGIANVRLQTSPAGAGTWTDVCTDTSAPYSCDFDTTAVSDGLRDVRALALDNAGYSRTSTVVAGRRIDNTAPSSATLTDPGTPLSGTVTLAAAAADAGSGVASVRIERSPAGGSTWTAICTDASSPYSCAFDTTTVTDVLYDLRAVAVDAAGNTRASTVVASRRVDNLGPSVVLTDPGSPLRGSVTLAATASDPVGVTSVTIQRKPAAGSTWTPICTDVSSPYSCAWSTTALTDGSYDLRATAVDTLGHSTTSATVAARVVDNTAPTASDVQAVNGSGTAFRIDSADVLTLTYSEAMKPASILAGWTGTSQAVTVRVTQSGSLDTLSIYDAADTTRLSLTATTPALQLKADHTTGQGARFNATAVMTGTQVVITLGALVSGSTKAVTATIPMVWTPSTAATDLAGNPGTATAATESGTADKDF